MKKSGLGRGLDVLLPSLDTDAGQDDTRQLPIHLLDPNPFQRRPDPAHPGDGDR